MFWRRRAQDDPFAALSRDASYESTPTTAIDGLGTRDVNERAATEPATPVTGRGAVSPVRSAASRRSGRPPAGTGRRPLGLALPAIAGVLILVAAVVGVSSSTSSSSPRPTLMPVTALPAVSSTTPAVTATTPSVTDASPTVANTAPRTATGQRATGRRTRGPRSYLSGAGVRAGLADIRRLGPGVQVTTLTILRGSMFAVVRLGTGRIKAMAIGLRSSDVLTGAPTGGQRIPLGQIRSRAISRILNGLRRHFPAAARTIESIVLFAPPGRSASWVVETRAGAHGPFAARLDGTHLRTVSRR